MPSRREAGSEILRLPLTRSPPVLSGSRVLMNFLIIQSDHGFGGLMTASAVRATVASRWNRVCGGRRAGPCDRAWRAVNEDRILATRPPLLRQYVSPSLSREFRY